MKINYNETKNTSPIPEDLADVIEKTKVVSRYEDPRYPKGMITDTLYDHLNRLASLVEHLGLEEQLKQDVLRTIWVHDLPETELGDQPTVLKSDGLVEIQDELSVASRIFSEKDLELYKSYESSSDFLKGSGEEYSSAGLIVKILDSLDGNLFFHTHVRDWVLSGSTTLPPETALEYTFTQYQKFKTRVGLLEDDNLKTFLNDLLDWEIDQIQGFWSGSEHLIPEAIRKHLE